MYENILYTPCNPYMFRPSSERCITKDKYIEILLKFLKHSTGIKYKILKIISLHSLQYILKIKIQIESILLLLLYFIIVTPKSLVGVAIMLRAGRSAVRIPAAASDFTLLKNVHIWSGAHSAS